MKKRKNLLFIGGDARYLEVIKYMGKKNFNILLAGFDHLDFTEKNIQQISLKNTDFAHIDVIILPVGGINKAKEVRTEYSNHELILTEKLISRTPAHCVIYTGISTPELDQVADFSKRKVIPLFQKDEVAIMNSIPTAEGTLKIAIEETNTTIHGADVIVLGFGRIGFTIAQLFHSVGAEVSIGIRRAADAARARQMGIKPVMLNNLSECIKSYQICINTIPQLLLSAEVIQQMNKSSLIIDLASHPGGTDFSYAEKKGIRTIHALGLPGKTAPVTAGKIIAEALLHSITEELEQA